MLFLEKISDYVRISKVGGISRRYFVMNAFDGAMTVLGIVIAAYFSGVHDSYAIISAGLGASVAMGVSGFSGAYLTEESEKNMELKRIERSMLKDLRNTVIGRANRFASIWAALVDGLSPALAAVLSLVPFLINKANLLSIDMAMKASIGVSFAIIFSLGVYLGKISEKNLFAHGIKTLFAGIVVAGILFLLNYVI